MAIDLGSAVVSIKTDTSQLASGIDGAKVLMLGLAAGAVAAGAEAVKMAGNFEAANTRLATSAGESQKNLAMVSAGVLQISVDTATSTDQLEAGMYTIESSGAHGKAALDELAAAAKGAKSENADLKDVANAETTIMVDYADKHITAANAVNDLIATVSRGKTTLQDLSASFSNVLPTANAVGVSLYDVSGAMATMTGEGVPAADAATYLRQTLMSLERPSTSAKSLLADIGLTAAQVSDEMKVSLPGTLTLIEDHLKAKFPEGSHAYVDALATIAGGTKTIQGILDLTGTHLDVFEQNVAGVTEAVKSGGTQIDGFALAQQNFNFQVDKGRQMVDALAIKFGTALFPEAEKLVTVFEQDMLPRLNDLSNWVTSDGLPALDRFGTWFSGTAVPAAEALANTVERNLLPPLETLASDTVPLIQQFANWVQSTQAVQLAIQDVSSTLGGFASTMSSFEEGLMNGNPQVALLAGGITAVGTAIGLIKIEEFAAGLYNSFQKLQDGNGFIANLSAKALPELNTALGWTKTAAQETAVEVEAIGTKATSATEVARADFASLIASFDEVDGAAAGTEAEIAAVGTESVAAEAVVGGAALGMTAVMAGATAGISLLVGAVVAAVIEGNGKISQSVKESEAQLGTSADDNAAKAKATAIASATVAGEQWHSSYAQQIKDSNNARAQMIIDQQKIADAAEQAAMRADNAWAQASQNGDIIGLLKASGWTDAQIRKYLGVNTGSVDQGPVTTGAHASGGVIPPGQYGMVDDQPGASNGELMYGGTSGISVLPAGPTGALLGGGVQEIHIHNHHYWNGKEVTDLVMTEAVKKIRVSSGMRR